MNSAYLGSKFKVRGDWLFWWDPPSGCEWGYNVWKGSKNIVEPRTLGVVGVDGAPSYGVMLASVWILWVEWAWLDYMCLHHEFYDSKSFLWHFQLWYTGICVCSRPCYVFLCVCEYDMLVMYVVWRYVFAQ